MSEVLRISGIGLFLIGIWQLYVAWKYYRFLHQKGTDNVFSPLALYSRVIIGIFAFVLGITLIISPMGAYNTIMQMMHN